jgi:hypothetical protein
MTRTSSRRRKRYSKVTKEPSCTRQLLRTPLLRSSQNAQKAKFAEFLFHALV